MWCQLEPVSNGNAVPLSAVTFPRIVPDVDTLAKRLKASRESANLGVRSLARLSGVSHGQISKLERGGRGDRAEFDTIAKLAKALRVDATWLYDGTEPPQNKVVRKAPHPSIDRWIEAKQLPEWVAEAAGSRAGGFASSTDEEIWEYCTELVQKAERRPMPRLAIEDEQPKKRRR